MLLEGLFRHFGDRRSICDGTAARFNIRSTSTTPGSAKCLYLSHSLTFARGRIGIGLGGHGRPLRLAKPRHSVAYPVRRGGRASLHCLFDNGQAALRDSAAIFLGRGRPGIELGEFMRVGCGWTGSTAGTVIRLAMQVG
jgi:hypothetical protein